MDHEKTEEIYRLMARSLSGEASGEEMLCLQQALQINPEMLQQYELMQRMWQIYSLKEIGEHDCGLKVENILHKAGGDKDAKPKQNGVLKKLHWLAAAAVIGIVIAGGWFWYNQWNKQPQLTAIQEIATDNGSRSRNVLPDGTVVWLNAGSKLKLLPGFNKKVREVVLEGEGYFDVLKNSLPFIVHVADVKLTVLGTAFNVRYFKNEKKVETTLVHGSLKVSKKGEKPVILKPKEKLVLLEKEMEDRPAESKTIEKLSADHPSQIAETAWMYNRLEFRGDDFETLAGKLERWYNVKIIFTDTRAKQLSFNGSFEDETIVQALDALKLVAPFHYKINQNEILISSP